MKGFRFLVDSKCVRISEAYALEKNIPVYDAIKLFFSSVTYRLLNNEQTGIYLEVFECVYDMFLEEIGEIAA